MMKLKKQYISILLFIKKLKQSACCAGNQKLLIKKILDSINEEAPKCKGNCLFCRIIIIL